MKHTDINIVLIARILGYIYKKGSATVGEIVKTYMLAIAQHEHI